MTRVAIVEDNPDTLLLIKTLLSKSFAVETYEDGKQAADGLTATPPDLVLLDISLPKMSGIEVFQHLKNNHSTKSLPVIAFTTQKPREFFLEHGFDDYIQKPVDDLFSITQKIQNCLSLYDLTESVFGKQKPET